MSDLWDDISQDDVESIIENQTHKQKQSKSKAVFVTSEVVRRIEQAKLYESLLEHDFFHPDSASQEIIDVVTEEIRNFIIERLETLVGLRNQAETTSSSVFTEDEVKALKAIAGRLITKRDVEEEDSSPVRVANTPEPNKPIQQAKARNIKPQPAGKKRINPRNPPKSMPSQAEMDQINARSVTKHQMLNNGASSILNTAISLAQKNNRDVKED